MQTESSNQTVTVPSFCVNAQEDMKLGAVTVTGLFVSACCVALIAYCFICLLLYLFTYLVSYLVSVV